MPGRPDFGETLINATGLGGAVGLELVVGWPDGVLLVGDEAVGLCVLAVTEGLELVVQAPKDSTAAKDTPADT